MTALVNRRRVYTGSSSDIDYSKMYFTIESLEDNNTISIENTESNDRARTFSYSTDNGKTWTDVTVAIGTKENIAILNEEEKVLIKSNNGDRLSNSLGYHIFSGNNDFKIYGNIMSLLRGDNFVSNPELPSTTYHFNRLFQEITTLVDAENLILPSIVLYDSSYRNMFNGCTNLVSAPQLPATTLGDNCYRYMFYGCTSLTKIPSLLRAETLKKDCYRNMFDGCTSLVNAPELPATTLASNCYNSMFSGCSSLTEASELPAMTLAIDCYSNMFKGCISLAEAPELPATTLAQGCYDYMFCMSETETLLTPAMTKAPVLPATVLTNYCYRSMFRGNGNLSEVACYATDRSASSCTDHWLSNCSSTGTFIKSPSASWDRNANGIPSGWTVYSDGLLGISINGSNSIEIRSTPYSVIYNPSDTLDKYKGVTWSVLSGSATITQDGVLTPTEEGTVVIQAVSTYDSSITATKTISVISNLYQAVQSIYWNETSGPAYIDTGLKIRESLEVDIIPLSYNAPSSGVSFKIGGRNSNNGSSTTDGITIGYRAVSNSGKCILDIHYMNTETASITVDAGRLLNIKITSEKATVNGTVYAYNSTPTIVEPSYTAYIGGDYNQPNPNVGKVYAERLFRLKIDDNTFMPVKRLTDNKVGMYCQSTGVFLDFSVFDAKVYEPQPFEDNYFTIESLEDGNAITIQNVGATVKPTIYYSLDEGNTWGSVTMTNNGTKDIATINSGDKVLFKSVNDSLASAWNKYNKFNGSKNFKVYGNAMSLIYGEDFEFNTEFNPDKGLNLTGLFYGTTTLVDAGNLVLPANRVNANGYNGMFRDCSNLVTAPKLPATWFSGTDSYASMFEGCISLVEAPELSATTLNTNCYSRMFCMSRTAKLTTPAMTKSPVLPAASLGSNSYNEMFKGNGNLVEITCLATSVGSNASDWVLNISSTGTFKKNADMSSWTTGTSGIPSGWTVEDYVE